MSSSVHFSGLFLLIAGGIAIAIIAAAIVYMVGKDKE